MARYGRYGGLEPERFEGSRMSQTLRIINPNWNTAVTESMSSALDGMRHDGGPQLDCVSLEGGPSALKARQIRYASRRSSRKTPNPTTRRMRSSSRAISLATDGICKDAKFMNVAPATAPSAFPSPMSKEVPIPSPRMSAVGRASRRRRRRCHHDGMCRDGKASSPLGRRSRCSRRLIAP